MICKIEILFKAHQESAKTVPRIGTILAVTQNSGKFGLVHIVKPVT